MTTDYDPIAEQYKRSKETPWRTHVECFTLLETIGPLEGLSVLDVACGEGFYTRLLRHRGAARMAGVDLSALALPDEYDLVVAAYLLNYATTREELGAMCGSIARCLRPGGRFVTVNSNPALDFTAAPSYRQYGFETSVAGAWREGAPITWTFVLEDGSFSIENSYLPVPARVRVLGTILGISSHHLHRVRHVRRGDLGTPVPLPPETTRSIPAHRMVPMHIGQGSAVV